MRFGKAFCLALYLSAAWFSGYLCGLDHPFSTRMGIVCLIIGSATVGILTSD